MNLNTENLTQTINQLIKNETPFPQDVAKQILEDKSINILSILASAYELRKKHFGNTVQVHVINNTQNGSCPEDCSYCAQGKNSKAEIQEYRFKSEEETLEEARLAYENGLLDIAWCHQVGVLNKELMTFPKQLKVKNATLLKYAYRQDSLMKTWQYN